LLPSPNAGWLRGVGIRLVSAATYYYDDEGNRAVVRLGEPIRSAYVLIERDHLANVTSLEPERWKREHPEFRRRIGIR